MGLKWEWEVIENKIIWRFVDLREDGEKKVIGSVISTEIWKEYWDVEAECPEIGYKSLLESVNKNEIRSMVLSIKKFIQEGVEKKNIGKNRAIILR